MTDEELNERVELTKKVIVNVINNNDFYKFTQASKEQYLNHSWQILNKFIKDNKGGN